MSVFYSEIATKDEYKANIQKFWILNNIDNPLYTTPMYALPNGCCTIVFISGNGVQLNYAGKEIELSAGIYLSGQITKRVAISVKPFSKAIMAQVKPWLPPILTNVSMNELVDEVRSFEFINRAIYRQLTDIDLADEQLVIDALYKALDSFPTVNDDSYFIQWACKRLQMSASAPENIADIAVSSGYSQRRVEQKFKALIGFTAKELQSIIQLRRLIDDLSTPNYDHLGVLAHRYGYYDQSHFIRSYQRIISETPSQFKTDDYLLPLTGNFDFLQS